MTSVRSLERASVYGRTSLETKVHHLTFLHSEFYNKHYTEDCSKQRPQLASHQPAYIHPYIHPLTYNSIHPDGCNRNPVKL